LKGDREDLLETWLRDVNRSELIEQVLEKTLQRDFFKGEQSREPYFLRSLNSLSRIGPLKMMPRSMTLSSNLGRAVSTTSLAASALERKS